MEDAIPLMFANYFMVLLNNSDTYIDNIEHTFKYISIKHR